MFSKSAFSGFFLDFERGERTGIPEVVLAKGKTFSQILLSVEKIFLEKGEVLLTKIPLKFIDALQKKMPFIKFNRLGKIGWSATRKQYEKMGPVSVITAGSSDIAVAVECVITLRFLGISSWLFRDCGVSDLRRIFFYLDKIKKTKMSVVICGMEASLPSVLRGLCKNPVIVVPTSVSGYGVSFGGGSSFLSSMSSCSPGISVVNIDNGFGAACFAKLCFEALK